MANIEVEDIVKALNVIQGEKENQAKEEALRERVRQEVLQEIREEMAKSKAPEAEAKVEADDPKEAPTEEEEQKPSDREDRFITKSLETGLEKSGLSSDIVDGLSSFLNYATLKNDEGEADEAKIASLVDLVSTVARREPPKGSTKRDLKDNGGFGKYLQEKK